ncbi:PTS sugar transporter subunit IIA [Clostridium coskatii]|uniref:PTS system mannose-specific EIIBCA component n=1 Tax=Clostridium coskatii TaxID=1705578 RepID=A0A170NN38_9CLOT|nr:fructose PTS transporter subunit IIA [Clostridium coskatii]OAA93253.1 PTS system mannose-specific EIIBCA component [Clostridium coskatii]OBR95364.1 PTS system mannose-specific EIIBCA component [Clostridium coskatii]
MNDIINKDLVVLDLEASSKEEVIRKLSKLIEKQEKLIDFDGYVKQVFEREKDFPTSIGFDVAIPHGKSDSVKSAAVAFARLKKEVKWSEEESVKYVFLIAVPEKEAGDRHLQILAQLSRKIMREEFRTKLCEASSIEEILEALDS